METIAKLGCDMITWCDTHVGFLSTVLTFALVAVTALYVRLTHQSLAELRAQRKESYRVRLEIMQLPPVREPFLAAFTLLDCRIPVGIAYVSLTWNSGKISFRRLDGGDIKCCLSLDEPLVFMVAEPHSLDAAESALASDDVRLRIYKSSEGGVGHEPVSRDEVRAWLGKWVCALTEYCKAYGISSDALYMEEWWQKPTARDKA